MSTLASNAIHTLQHFTRSRLARALLFFFCFNLVVFVALTVPPAIVLADASTHAPKGVFSESFLLLLEDAKDAEREGKRLLIFFEQDGCPACRRMAENTFRDAQVQSILKRDYTLLAINIHGARETTWIDNKLRSEKDLAAFLGVRATPTLLMLDGQGKVLARKVGYQSAADFSALLSTAPSKKY
jgi:thioredoxin-related protein